MNDKQQLAAMGEHMAEQPMCMAKRIEELEAQMRVMAGLLREAVAWMDDHPAMPDSSMMHAALSGTIQHPTMYAPEGWQLVPVEPTVEIITLLARGGCRILTSDDAVARYYRDLLAAAPKPDSTK